jgi:hypothetical protein
MFFITVCLDVASEYASFVMGRFGIHNLWLIQISHVVGYVLFTMTLTRWQTAASFRSLQRYAIIPVLLVWVVAKITFAPITGSDEVGASILSILIAITAVVTLVQIADGRGGALLRDPRFLLSGGLLLSSAASVIFLSVFDRLVGLSREDFLLIWQVHWGLSAAVNCIYAAGFLMVRR